MFARTADRASMLQVHLQLSHAAEQGTLTTDRLSQAVEAKYYNPADAKEESVGVSWIREHAEQFAKAVGNVTAFLRSHMENREFMWRVLQSAEVMVVIPESERSLFVFDAYVRHGAYHNDYWLRYALKAGVSRFCLALAIGERIVRSEPEESDSGYHSPSGEFMDSYAGTYQGPETNFQRFRFNSLDKSTGFNWSDEEYITWDENRAWSLFDAEHFYKVITICVEKAPRQILQHRSVLALRIPPEPLEALCVLAAKRITNINRVDPKELRSLPVDVRVDLSKRLELSEVSIRQVNAAFLVGVLVDVGYEKSYQIYCELRSQFDKFNAWVALYQEAVRYTTPNHRHQRVGAKLKELFAYRLEEAGYAIGIIRKGPNPKGGTQWEVQHKGLKYIQENRSYEHRYWPSEGDEVIFNLNSKRHITPTVAVVSFTPTDSSKGRS